MSPPPSKTRKCVPPITESTPVFCRSPSYCTCFARTDEDCSEELLVEALEGSNDAGQSHAARDTQARPMKKEERTVMDKKGGYFLPRIGSMAASKLACGTAPEMNCCSFVLLLITKLPGVPRTPKVVPSVI